MNIENNDIIDIILSEQQGSKLEIQAQIVDNQILIDDQTFFLDIAAEGLMTKMQFRELMQEDRSEIEAFKLLIEHMNADTKFRMSALPYTSKNKKKYYYLSVVGKKGSQDFKIMCRPGIKELISGYQSAKYDIRLSLAGLYTEAKNDD